MMLDRRAFCALPLALPAPPARAAYEPRNLIVHLHLRPQARAYVVGDVVYDLQCRRHFQITKTLETPSGLLAKTRWVAPAT